MRLYFPKATVPQLHAALRLFLSMQRGDALVPSENPVLALVLATAVGDISREDRKSVV